jgi:outer membrane beta-barrel protein
MRKFASICLGMMTCLGLWSTEAMAGREPAQNALEARNQDNTQDVVQNRFFLKEGRFELSGTAGYVPNNPMVQRFSGGFLGAYHLNERFAAEGAVMYFPDLGSNDLKGLTQKLVEIANSRSSGSNFEQPVEKMMLGATVAARWSPIYGKINLLGENVLNFDLYLTGGFGMISTKAYYAYADENDSVQLRFEGNRVHPPITAGLGTNLFVNQSLAVKLDVRSLIYRAPAPIYDPNQADLNEYRIYNDIVTSVGISYFIPKMKPRLMDF